MNNFNSRNFCERHVGRKCPIERAFVEDIYTIIITTVPVDARAIIDIFFGRASAFNVIDLIGIDLFCYDYVNWCQEFEVGVFVTYTKAIGTAETVWMHNQWLWIAESI